VASYDTQIQYILGNYFLNQYPEEAAIASDQARGVYIRWDRRPEARSWVLKGPDGKLAEITDVELINADVQLPKAPPPPPPDSGADIRTEAGNIRLAAKRICRHPTKLDVTTFADSMSIWLCKDCSATNRPEKPPEVDQLDEIRDWVTSEERRIAAEKQLRKDGGQNEWDEAAAILDNFGID